MFPTLSEAVTHTRLTVATAFYSKWMVPIGLVLLFLTGIGPLLAWRKSSLRNLRDQFMWPVISGAAVAILVTVLGIRMWSSGLCFTLCGFVAGTIVQEFWRGAQVRRKNTGTDVFTALVGLVGRNKRRYGGYIVHLGIVLIFLGFGGNGSKIDDTIQLTLHEQKNVGHYTVRNDGVKAIDDGQKQIVTGYIAVFRDGKQLDTMYPGKSIFRKRENEEPRTEIAIRRTIAEDLYLVLPQVDFGTQTIALQVIINPLVNWIWLGFGILALGTGIALLPERAYSFAVARLPAEVAGSAIALLLVLALSAPLSAQQTGAQSMELSHEGAGVVPAANALEEQMRQELVCTCPTCGHRSLTNCPCSQAQDERRMLAEQVKLGKTRDQIRDFFVEAYGGSQEALGAPIDKGFNRLAWLVPYSIGGTGIVVIGLVALRWSRHRSDSLPAPAEASDPALDERLDDELRNLD
jgi:cytochrome c-type biogenesis protein CcmF